MLTLLRRALSYRVSVADLSEIAMWFAAGYLAIGLTWSLCHPDAVQHIQARLEEQLYLPVGTDDQLLALGEASVLWPVILVLPAGGCAH